MNDRLAEHLPLQDATRQRMENVRSALLHLHKILLAMERDTYERLHGRVSSGDMLKIVLQHPQFAWLHSLSELIVRIDEVLDMKEPPQETEVVALLTEIRALLLPSDADSRFARKYHEALQNSPAAILAHRAATLLLPIDSKTARG